MLHKLITRFSREVSYDILVNATRNFKRIKLTSTKGDHIQPGQHVQALLGLTQLLEEDRGKNYSVGLEVLETLDHEVRGEGAPGNGEADGDIPKETGGDSYVETCGVE